MVTKTLELEVSPLPAPLQHRSLQSTKTKPGFVGHGIQGLAARNENLQLFHEV